MMATPHFPRWAVLSLAVVCLHDVARDTPALGCSVAFLVRPLANSLILVAARATGARGSAATSRANRGPADPGRRVQERVERLAQLAGVLLREVDRVVHTVESELDGTVGLSAVEVVGQKGYYLLGHGVPAPTAMSFKGRRQCRYCCILSPFPGQRKLPLPRVAILLQFGKGSGTARGGLRQR